MSFFSNVADKIKAVLPQNVKDALYIIEHCKGASHSLRTIRDEAPFAALMPEIAAALGCDENRAHEVLTAIADACDSYVVEQGVSKFAGLLG